MAKTAPPDPEKIKLREVYVTILPNGRLHAKDAAAYLGITANGLSRLRWESGKGPPFTKAPNGKIYYLKKDLDEYIAHSGKLTQAPKRPPKKETT